MAGVIIPTFSFIGTCGNAPCACQHSVTMEQVMKAISDDDVQPLSEKTLAEIARFNEGWYEGDTYHFDEVA